MLPCFACDRGGWEELAARDRERRGEGGGGEGGGKEARKVAANDAQRAAGQAKRVLKKTYTQERTRGQEHSAANGAAKRFMQCWSSG
jgi:hypothetical protein